MSEELAPIEQPRDLVQDYTLKQDENDGRYTATVVIDGVRYEITPTNLDPSVILADRRRYSRAGDIENMMGTPYEQMALFNRAVLLTAFDAFESGNLPKDAWDSYRVAVTKRHDALKKAFRSSEQTAVGEAAARAKPLPPRTQRTISSN